MNETTEKNEIPSTEECKEKREFVQTAVLREFAHTVDELLLDSLRGNVEQVVFAVGKTVIWAVEAKETARVLRLWRIFQNEIITYEMSLFRKFRAAGGVDAVKAFSKLWAKRTPDLKKGMEKLDGTMRPHPSTLMEMGKLERSHKDLDRMVNETFGLKDPEADAEVAA